MYYICVELRHRSTERQLTHGELAREAGDLLDMWEKRVTEGKQVPPVRRANAAQAAEHGPTPISCFRRSTTATSRTGWGEMDSLKQRIVDYVDANQPFKRADPIVVIGISGKGGAGNRYLARPWADLQHGGIRLLLQ